MQTERDEEQGSRPGLVERAFAPQRLPAELRTPPAIVVGLPRSGTKFLTHVMNNIRGLYVFDDLYYFREARGAGAGNTLTRAQLEHVVGWLAARSMPERREQHFVRHVLDPADVERLRQALLDAFGGDAVPVEAPLEEWMLRLAMLNGCDHWGYKAPQDFLIMDELARYYPGAKFLFIYRDPRSMMASYKFVPERYGDARQYHPVPYALYWRMAHREIGAREARHPILHVKFEDLIREPRETGRGIASFLDLPWTDPSVPDRVNTSFDQKKRSEITPTERWIAERIAGDAMRRAGYPVDEGRFRLRDLPDLLLTSVRFVVRQGWKALTTPRNRESAKAFVRRLFHGAPAKEAAS